MTSDRKIRWRLIEFWLKKGRVSRVVAWINLLIWYLYIRMETFILRWNLKKKKNQTLLHLYMPIFSQSCYLLFKVIFIWQNTNLSSNNYYGQIVWVTISKLSLWLSYTQKVLAIELVFFFMDNANFKIH